MKTKPFSAISIFLAISIMSADALSKDRCWRKESKLDKKQYAYTDVRVADSGKVTVKTLFSNGKRLDGDTFAARIALLDRSNHFLMGIQHVRGVNATYGGKTREVKVRETRSLHSNLVPRVSSVRVLHFQKDRLPDGKIGELIGKIVGYFIGPIYEQDVDGERISYSIQYVGEEKQDYVPPEDTNLPKARRLKSCP